MSGEVPGAFSTLQITGTSATTLVVGALVGSSTPVANSGLTAATMTMPTGAPSITTNKVYQVGGELFFSGSKLVAVISGNATLAGNLLFSPNATQDIGTSVGSQPRDYWGSRDITIARNFLTTAGTIVGQSNNNIFGDNTAALGLGFQLEIHGTNSIIAFKDTTAGASGGGNDLGITFYAQDSAAAYKQIGSYFGGWVTNTATTGYAYIASHVNKADGTTDYPFMAAQGHGMNIFGTSAPTGAGAYPGANILKIFGQVDLSGSLGGQIVFPSTENASSNANTLDDYSEGSWTPVLGGDGGTSGQTYSVQIGRYVKVGRAVTATGTLTLSAKGTITGNVQIQGLPYAVSNVTNLQQGGSVGYFSTLATNWSFLSLSAVANTTTAYVTGIGAAASGVSLLATADIQNTSVIRFTLAYLADS